MVSKVLFLIGLTFLGSSAGLFIILSYLSPLPERSSQKIPLPPSNCYCRGSGGPPPTITPTSPSTPTPDLSNIPEVGDVPIDVLTVEGEWPSQLDINSSDNVTVLIATPGFIGDPNLLT